MLKELRPALILLLLMTALTGLAYPLAITGIAQGLFPDSANGSLIVREGQGGRQVIGSALIGQDGALLGVGSLLVQEALGPGAPAFPGNMYVPINRLKPIFKELVDNGRLSTPARPWPLR